MSEHTTVAPSAAGATAIARPLPELDPVTTATLILDVFPSQTSFTNSVVGIDDSGAEVLGEPVTGQRAGLIKTLGIDVEVTAGQDLDPLGLPRLLVRGDRQVCRREDVVDRGQQQQRGRADVLDE